MTDCMTDTRTGNFDKREARRACSAVGWACFAFMLISQLGALGLKYLYNYAGLNWGFDPPLWLADWSLWLVSYIPLYLLGMPAFLLILRLAPASPRQPRRKVRPRSFLALLLVVFALVYLSNMVTLLVVYGIQLLSGSSFSNPLETIALGSDILPTVVFAAVIAPIMEELLFRGALLRRMRRFGEGLAIFASGFMFGLFHANIYQILYAFVIGCLLAYVALRTESVLVPILLHMAVNCIGVLLAPLAADNEILTALFGLFVIGCIGGGGYIFFSRLGRVRLLRGDMPLSEPAKFGLFFGNSGVIMYLLLIAALTASLMFLF